ncbi:MAG: SagB/ThcOx family dehydrogenase [Asticcacaulis sp.]|nr:SagB/ThcOx family dehydrogenase [Asticcacaulis sp.]
MAPTPLVLHRLACDPDSDEREQLEIAQELTRYHRGAMSRRNRRIGAFMRDADNVAEAAVLHPVAAGQTLERLPDVVLPDLALADVLARRRSPPRAALAGRVNLQDLSAILALAARANGAKPAGEGTAEIYDARRHALIAADGAPAEFASVEPAQAPPVPCAIVVTGVFARALRKYGGRGYRFAVLEAGQISQNLMLAATAVGLPSLAYGSFYDAELERMLGVDGVSEAVLAVVLIGGETSPCHSATKGPEHVDI